MFSPDVLLSALVTALSATSLGPGTQPPERPAIVADVRTATIAVDSPVARPVVRQSTMTDGLKIRGQVGFITAVGDTGLVGGVAVGKPLPNRNQVEVYGELSFCRLYESGILIVSGGANVTLQQIGQGDMHPYVGGGVAVAKWLDDFGGSEAGLFAVVGVPLKLAERNEVRIEGRLGIITGNPLLVVVGIGF